MSALGAYLCRDVILAWAWTPWLLPAPWPMTAPGYKVLLLVFLLSQLMLSHPQLWPLFHCSPSYSQHAFQILLWVSPHKDPLGPPPGPSSSSLSDLWTFVPRVLLPTLPCPTPLFGLLLLSFWNISQTQSCPSLSLQYLHMGHASLGGQISRPGKNLWLPGLGLLQLAGVLLATFLGPWEPGCWSSDGMGPCCVHSWAHSVEAAVKD